MALGKRSSESQFSPAGSASPPPPPPPPPPTGEPYEVPSPPAPITAVSLDPPASDPAGHDTPEEARADVVTALDARLQELQATVAALVDKSIDPESVMAPHPQPEPEPVTVTAPGDLDPDVLEASRTLQMAKRTADALLSEARDEAAEITRVAREQADRELETQRHALASEQLAWEQRRRELITLFEELDDVLGTQRSQADRAHEVVRQVLAGPVADPIVDLPEPTVVNDNGATQPADVVDLADPASVPTPPFGTHDDLSSVPVFTAAPEPSSETGFHIVTAQDETVPTAEPDLQTFGAPPSEAATLFGTPPTESDPPAATDAPPTPFYPWADDQQSPAVAPAGDETPAPPPPPVQRRGLFGH